MKLFGIIALLLVYPVPPTRPGMTRVAVSEAFGTEGNYCEEILYNDTQGIVSIHEMHPITEDANISANINGTIVTDLTNKPGTPGSPDIGSNVRFEGTKNRAAYGEFYITLLSHQIAQAIAANKTVIITMVPGQMSRHTVRTINFPASPDMNCK